MFASLSVLAAMVCFSIVGGTLNYGSRYELPEDTSVSLGMSLVVSATGFLAFVSAPGWVAPSLFIGLVGMGIIPWIRHARGTWRSLAWRFTAVLPVLVLSNIPYLISGTSAAKNAAPSADLVSFGTSALWFETRSYLDLLKNIPKTIGWSWMSYMHEFSFPIGDALAATLFQPLVHTSTLESVNLVTSLALGSIALTLFNLAKKVGASNFSASLSSALIGSTIPLLESAYANSAAFLVGSSIFISFLSSRFANPNRCERRRPILDGLLLSGLIAIYPQYMLLAVPILVIEGLKLRNGLKNIVSTTALAVLISPLTFTLAVRFVILTGSSTAANTFSNPFFMTGWANTLKCWSLIAPILREYQASAGTLFPVAIAGILCWFLVIRQLHEQLARPFWIAVLFGGLGTLATGVLLHAPYSQYRLMRMTQVVILCILLIGFAKISIRHPKVHMSFALMLIAMLTFNVSTDPYLSSRSVADREIDSSYTELSSWLTNFRLGGAEVVVLSDDYITAHFALIALREWSNVKTPVLPVGYMKVSAASPWSAQKLRWVIADRLLSGHVYSSAVMARNSRFVLLDLSRGSYEFFVRAPDSRLNFGTHPFHEGRKHDVRLDSFHSLFVATNSSKIDISIRPGSRTHRLRVAGNVNDLGGYFSCRGLVAQSDWNVSVPILPEKSWAGITIDNLDAGRGSPTLVLPGSLELKKVFSDLIRR